MEVQQTRFLQNPLYSVWKLVQISKTEKLNIFITRLLDFNKFIPVPFVKARCTLGEKSHDSHSVFQGSGGYLYLYLKLYKFFKQLSEQNKNQLHKACKIKDEQLFKLIDAEVYLKKSILQYQTLMKYFQENKQKKNPNISFYFSRASVFLCGVHIGFYTNNQNLFHKNLSSLLQYSQLILHKSQSFQHQLLYGIPGYLYMLLQIQKNYQNAQLQKKYQVNLTKKVQKLVQIILSHGFQTYIQKTKTNINLNQKLPKQFRLIYLFFKKEYLGGAHGLSGVLNIIFLSLQYNKFQYPFFQRIKLLASASIEFLLRQQINGNFTPKSFGKTAQLVQFCHGAPGCISSLLRFQKLFPQEANNLKIKQKLIKFYDYIWKYGIIKKGYYGLCHGISGNSYPFINPLLKSILPQKIEQYNKKANLLWLMQRDQNIKKTLRQYKFSDRYFAGVSDYPYSLMLGTAGDIFYGCDLINGMGMFPGFDL